MEICYYRFAGLVRYLHPSDEELRVFSPPPVRDKREKKKVPTPYKGFYFVYKIKSGGWGGPFVL